MSRTHYCDVCGCPGTTYKCSGGTNYDMCKKCYDEAKVKVKANWKKWLEDHPEDKKSKKDKDDDDDEKEDASKSEAESDSKSGATSGQEDGKSDKSGDAADGDE